MSSNPIVYKVNGGTYPPFGVITANDKGSYVIIATWIAACVSILFTGVRITLRTRLHKTQTFLKDIVLICVALCFAIAQSVSAQESVRHGLGRHRAALDDQQFASYSTYAYVGQILSVFVFILSKLSLVVVFEHLIQDRKLRSVLHTFAAFILLWGVAGLFATAFQCGGATLLAPAPGCVNAKALLFAHGVVNIVSDAFLAIFPVVILWRIMIQSRKRYIILAMFSTRLAVCVIVGIQLSTLGPYLSGNDPSWDYLYPSFWNQFATHLSIITACIPMMKPFLDNLQSSLIDSSIPRNFQAKLTFDLQPWHASKPESSRSPKLRSFRSYFGRESASAMHSRNRNQSSDNHSNASEGVILVKREVDVRIA